jgi:hypothetical protein
VEAYLSLPGKSVPIPPVTNRRQHRRGLAIWSSSGFGLGLLLGALISWVSAPTQGPHLFTLRWFWLVVAGSALLYAVLAGGIYASRQQTARWRCAAQQAYRQRAVNVRRWSWHIDELELEPGDTHGPRYWLIHCRFGPHRHLIRVPAMSTHVLYEAGSYLRFSEAWYELPLRTNEGGYVLLGGRVTVVTRGAPRFRHTAKPLVARE